MLQTGECPMLKDRDLYSTTKYISIPEISQICTIDMFHIVLLTLTA